MIIYKTKQEFERYFREKVLPEISKKYEQDGKINYLARRKECDLELEIMAQNEEIPLRGVDWACPW